MAKRLDWDKARKPRPTADERTVQHISARADKWLAAVDTKKPTKRKK